MLPVLLIGGGIWALGTVAKVPVSVRLGMLGLLYFAVLLVHFALPDGHPVRASLGDEPDSWVVLGIGLVLVFVYRRGLRALRARVPQNPEQSPKQSPAAGRFSEAELERYARHIVLRDVGGAGQRALRDARVLVVGAGGLGSPALLYLAAAGVGTLGVIDADEVSLSNLQRQVLHTDARIGMPKVFSAQAALAALNPHVKILPYQRAFTAEIGAELLAEFDLVLDGTDSFQTRQIVNAAAVSAKIPLISGAIAQWEGQISVFDPARGAPCLACIFPTPPAPDQATSCAEAGVVGPLPGVIGTMMALEAIKVLTGAGRDLRGTMVLFDGLEGESRPVKIARRAQCEICGAR